jgi:diguanylate cyclase (GGDEF)-like protein
MSDRTPGPIEYMLRDVREALQMDVAFVSKFSEDQLVFRALEGDAESFGWQEGESFPVDESYCKRVLDGRIPQVVPDAKRDDATKDLRVTSEANMGYYCAVPLVLSDGRIYGTLCCVSHAPDPWLRERDLRLMERTASWLVKHLERLDSAMRSLGELATRDHLTGAYNRRAGEEHLLKDIARAERGGGTLSLAVLDIDRLKSVNDEHGHQAGDACLEHFACVLGSSVREGDWIARWGGDEFVVGVWQAQGEETSAKRVLERVAGELREEPPVLPSGEEVRLTFSVGVGQWRAGDDVQGLFRKADEALYGPKQPGGTPSSWKLTRASQAGAAHLIHRSAWKENSRKSVSSILY